jgi:diguanylate cyclase (GGDEF)-like protein/PAS domain S-box-containing protein
MNTENLYLEIINNLCDGVYFVDTERRITFWNKAAESITGYEKEEIVGRFCQDNILNHIDAEGKPLCIVGCPLFASIIDGRQRQHEVFLRHKDGHRIPVLVNIFPMRENGEIIGAIEIFTQNSPIVYEDKLVEHLSNQAMHDQLTGLANRRKLESYIEFKFNEMKRFQTKFCIIFMDIDMFGAFNNSYGHDLGDEVLKKVAKSIMLTTRKNDLFGRWGGEEFVGIFEIKNDYEATIVAEKMRVLISKSEIRHNDETLSVTASLGVTIGTSEDTIESVIKRADELMYKSKENGRNRITSDVK